MALRRWKPFLGAFSLIDAAIEGADADGPLSRDEFRSARARIVELLCDAAGDDGGGVKAEGICELLDEAMAESLATLRAVPVENMARRVLASGDLVGAVGALMRDHASERVRELARDVVRGWRAGARAEFTRAKAAMDVLDGFSSTPSPPPRHDTAPPAHTDSKLKKEAMKKATVISSRPVNTADPYIPSAAPIVSTSNTKKPSANMEARQSQPKKMPPAIVSVPEEEKKMESTKRKLHERYQEAEDAKRRRTIQVIKPPHRPPPRTTGPWPRNARARGPGSCTAERISVKSCSVRMMV